MFIAANLGDKFKQEVLKQCATRTYEIATSTYEIDDEINDKIFLLTPLSFNLEKQSLNEAYNLSASAVIKGDVLQSLLQYSPSSMMVCGWYKAIVVDMDTMDLLKTVNINGVPRT